MIIPVVGLVLLFVVGYIKAPPHLWHRPKRSSCTARATPPSLSCSAGRIMEGIEESAGVDITALLGSLTGKKKDRKASF